MRRIFGSKKEEVPKTPAPTLVDANSGVTKRISAYEEKINACDKQLRSLKEKIKTTKGPAKSNYERRAMEILKRKRMYEQQMDQMLGQQFNIEQTQFGLESATVTIATIGAMKEANTQLRTKMKEMNIDDVDDIQDDLAELMEEMDEVNESLGRSYAMPDDIDEADLEAELDLLEDDLEEGIDEGTPSYLQSTEMPAQPTGVPGDKTAVDDFGLPTSTPTAT